MQKKRTQADINKLWRSMDWDNYDAPPMLPPPRMSPEMRLLENMLQPQVVGAFDSQGSGTSSLLVTSSAQPTQYVQPTSQEQSSDEAPQAPNVDTGEAAGGDTVSLVSSGSSEPGSSSASQIVQSVASSVEAAKQESGSSQITVSGVNGSDSKTNFVYTAKADPVAPAETVGSQQAPVIQKAQTPQIAASGTQYVQMQPSTPSVASEPARGVNDDSPFSKSDEEPKVAGVVSLDAEPEPQAEPSNFKPKTPAATSTPRQPKADKERRERKPAGTVDNSKVVSYMQYRYGVGIYNRDQDPQYETFEYNGAKSSAEATERPQPSPTGGDPSPPAPVFGLAPKNKVQSPTPTKSEQTIIQQDQVGSALDMSLERLLLVLEQMALKYESFSQRLSVIEMILDRSG